MDTHSDAVEAWRLTGGVPGALSVRSDEVDWVADLTGPDREAAVERLHALLLRAALSEASRRSGRNGVTGPELDDVAHQAANDALLAVLRRLADFRGESRFTTWAYRFVVLEVSGKLARHTWRRHPVSLEPAHWDRLPGRLGVGPADTAQVGEMVRSVRDAVETQLTEHQRRVFEAIVLRGVPLDVLAEELHTNRNAIYKCLFDARRKIRTQLVIDGYLVEQPGELS